MNDITISIVSHDQDQILINLLNDLIKFKEHINKVIVTLNVFSKKKTNYNLYPYKIEVIENKNIKGFSANHNYAFKFCSSKYYCILNPDIRIYDNPFQILNKTLDNDNIAIVSPAVLNKNGEFEDNARFFPSPFNLIKKLLLIDNGTIKNPSKKKIIYPDWIAGMFMQTKASTFSFLNGFNEKYFLYYEDVDLCLRARKNNYEIALLTNCEVIHEAQRESHKRPKYFFWHSMSLIRFFVNHLGRFPKRN